MLRFLLTGPMSVFRHCSSQLRKKPGSRFAYFTRIRIPTTDCLLIQMGYLGAGAGGAYQAGAGGGGREPHPPPTVQGPRQ